MTNSHSNDFKILTERVETTQNSMFDFLIFWFSVIEMSFTRKEKSLFCVRILCLDTVKQNCTACICRELTKNTPTADLDITKSWKNCTRQKGSEWPPVLEESVKNLWNCLKNQRTFESLKFWWINLILLNIKPV